ncbi:hypothetical protein [Photobacterium leiognathi]|nr:hypothetical protein [Photobacterium leiognathi]
MMNSRCRCVRFVAIVRKSLKAALALLAEQDEKALIALLEKQKEL